MMEPTDDVDANEMGSRENMTTNKVESPMVEPTDGVDANEMDSSEDTTTNEVESPMVPFKDDHFYNMQHKRRGYALIFNQEKFSVIKYGQPLDTRTGTNTDCKKLKSCLEKLGFKVKDYQDLNFQKIEEKVEKARSLDHKDCDSFVMAILSHGDKGIVYAKDKSYNPEVLWKKFTSDNCPKLAGKPKMFFIQACQGTEVHKGTNMSRTAFDGVTTTRHHYKIPTYADFLIAYSTMPGYYAWRSTTNGSWFVQALCTELEENGTKFDLNTLLTFVARRVATDFESNTPSNLKMHGKKQIPCTMSMLTRLIWFKSKK